MTRFLKILFSSVATLLFLAFLFMTLGFFILDDAVSPRACSDATAIIMTLVTGAVLFSTLLLSLRISKELSALKKFLLVELFLVSAALTPSWIYYMFTGGKDALFFTVENDSRHYNDEGMAIFITLFMFPLMFYGIHVLKARGFFKKKDYADLMEWEATTGDSPSLIIHRSALKTKGDWKTFNLSILVVSGLLLVPAGLSILRGVLADLPLFLAEYGPAGILNNAGLLKLIFALAMLTLWGLIFYRTLIRRDMVLKFDNGHFTAGTKKIPLHEIDHARLERVEQRHYTRIGALDHPVFMSHIALSLHDAKGKRLFKYWFMDYRAKKLGEFLRDFFNSQNIELRMEHFSEFPAHTIHREFF